MSSAPSQSAEDYLERIHELIEEKGYARVVDIASSLRVKQASVTNMVKKLGELGYLKYERYRGLILTEKGRSVAERIQKRHETLSRF
ncbi:MAG: MarR family transcriptional regulator, partial [Limisphaerales bacterium]